MRKERLCCKNYLTSKPLPSSMHSISKWFIQFHSFKTSPDNLQIHISSPNLSHEPKSSKCLHNISTWLSNKHPKFNVSQTNPFIKNLSQTTSSPIFPILANGNSILACDQAKNFEYKPWLQYLSSSCSSSFSPLNIQSINKSCWLYLQNVSRM